MDPKPIDLTLSGKRVHAWVGGSGPALLLVHSAWGDAAMSWAPVWNELSRSFTVIAPDLPGFGASDPLEAPTLSANATVLKDLLGSATFVAIHNAGHLPQVERPEEFTDAMRRVGLG